MFIIEREFDKAAAFALAGTALIFFGFIHGEAIEVAQSLTVSLSYLMVAGLLLWVYKSGSVSAPVAKRHHEDGMDLHGMPADVVA